MLSYSRRFALVIILLAVSLAVVWFQRRTLVARVGDAVPGPQITPTADSQGVSSSSTPVPEFFYFLDVEGWYRVTPYETVVRSPYNLTAHTSEAMAAVLPRRLGGWEQVGEDEYIGDDPSVVYYLGQPTVAIQRTFRDATGQHLTLSVIGNKGEDSFLLFSHTPETCYPGRLWQVVENRRESEFLDDGAMHAQYLLTEHAETRQRLMVLFWYLWESPERDSEEGVLSVRVNLFIPPDQTEDEALARAWEFVRLLFPSTVQWERF